jgi:hypothetical protein
MDVTLTMTGAISGRIVWPNGSPVGIALVQALRPSYEEGKRTLTVVQSARTDDLGNYRLFWLPPGRYFISATPPNGPVDPTLTWNPDASNTSLSLTREIRRTVLTRPVTATKDDEIFAPIYYPANTPDAKAAVAVDVVSGGEVRGIDIMAGFVRTYRVRGVIVDNETGDVVKNAQVRATFGNQSGIVPLDPDTGSFSIGRLPAGSEYVLAATAGGKTGRFRISIRDHDFEIRVPLYSSFSVSGRVTVDGRAPRAEEIAGLRLMVQADPVGAGGLQPSATFASDGTSSFAVGPGDYFINIAPILNRTGVLVGNIPLGNIPGRTLPPNTAFNVPENLKALYVKSIRFGGNDVLNDGLHLSGPTSEILEIDLSTQAAALQGTVVDAKGAPAANVVAVLVPEPPLRHRPDLYRATRSDASGAFRIDRIPAGTYRLFAWENIIDGAWRDAEVIREYESRGTLVQIKDGETSNASLLLIEADAR